jgi:hypothetical protein
MQEFYNRHQADFCRYVVRLHNETQSIDKFVRNSKHHLLIDVNIHIRNLI